ncbi:MAG TPA: hypothetical protein VGH90_04255 [Chthoniobacteraceae bacterium]|jgi:hypothetical protein
MNSLLDLPLTPAKNLDSTQKRPARVAKVHGIILQSDIGSALGRLFIRPLEGLDQWWAGLLDGFLSLRNESKLPGARKPPLAMHAGIHVELENGECYVVEQLAGTIGSWVRDGLHWTPLKQFRARNHSSEGGWDITIPIEAFRQLAEPDAERAAERLNRIRGRPFLKEDCTGFISRAFGEEKRLFADSALARSLGFDLRSGEPAMPLIRRDYRFDPKTETRLRAEALRRLPDPVASSGTLSIRQLHHRLGITAICLAGMALGLFLRRQRSRG